MSSSARPSWSERFEKYVRRTPECWEWTGAAMKARGGYGQLNLRGKVCRAHRLAWELYIGPIPQGLWVLHRCDNPVCVRPEHLFLGTARDNVVDMRSKGRGYDIPASRGEASPNAKLTADSVREIRQHLTAGVSMAAVARQFGVTRQAIQRIRDHETWKAV